MTEIRDELIDRVVDELRTLPPVDEAAVGRIVRAAASTPGVVHGPRSAVRGGSWWQSRVPLAAAAGIALAAGLAGYAARDLVQERAPTPTAAAARAEPGAASLVSADLAPRVADRAVPTQFVLDAPRASRVALVGDFNAWDETAAPLTRDPSSGIWTISVPLSPGRHVYAFLVDGKTLTVDPRAPTARDPDFDTPSSVVLVGAP